MEWIDRASLTHSDGFITHVAEVELEKPIPFKKGDNLWLKVADYLPPNNPGKWDFSWYEFD